MHAGHVWYVKHEQLATRLSLTDYRHLFAGITGNGKPSNGTRRRKSFISHFPSKRPHQFASIRSSSECQTINLCFARFSVLFSQAIFVTAVTVVTSKVTFSHDVALDPVRSSAVWILWSAGIFIMQFYTKKIMYYYTLWKRRSPENGVLL